MSLKKTLNIETQIQANEKNLYIYADVDIDKAYSEILIKSKKIKSFLEENRLDSQFPQRIRQYKNFRIIFDSQIQHYIHKKELNSDLRMIKKHVFNGLEDFIIGRYKIVLEEEILRKEYEDKVNQIERKFLKRMEQLSKSLEN